MPPSLSRAFIVLTGAMVAGPWVERVGLPGGEERAIARDRPPSDFGREASIAGAIIRPSTRIQILSSAIPVQKVRNRDWSQWSQAPIARPGPAFGASLSASLAQACRSRILPSQECGDARPRRPTARKTIEMAIPRFSRSDGPRRDRALPSGPGGQ